MNQNRKLTTSTGTAGKCGQYVVKQQQLGIFKSKSNTLQHTPKARRPLQQKELSFYSIASYSNNNSLNDQSKSMTLNPSSKNYAYKERTLSPTNQSSWTPSPTQSNVSFALKYSNSTNHDLEANFSPNFNTVPPARSARCHACWIKKCIDVYYSVQFDEKIMNILNDFHPIQLASTADELKNNVQSSTQLNQPFSPKHSTTLTKQKRYYTNNKLKSKSVCRLYYNGTASDKASISNLPNGKATLDSSKSTTQTNRTTNELTNGLTKSIDQQPNPANSSFNGSSTNESNCSNSMKDSNDSTNESNNSNATIDSPIKSKDKTSSTNTTSGLNRSNIPTPSSKTKSNGKLNNNRSNSNASSNTINLSSKTPASNKNTITLNNLPFKSNAFSSIQKSTVVKHTSILPNGSTKSSGLSNVLSNSSTDGEPAKPNETHSESQIDCETKVKRCNCDVNSDSKCMKCLDELNENGNKLDQTNTVHLIFKTESDTEHEKDENNINTIEILNGDSISNELTKTDSNYIKLSTVDHNNLNLLLNTNIHNRPERV